MKNQLHVSKQRERDILALTAKLTLALDVSVQFSRADSTGLVWLDRSIRKNPFCECLNRQRAICRSCASSCFPSACFELDHKNQIGTTFYRFSCMVVSYLVTPVFMDGVFCGVLGCGPVFLEKPTRAGFMRMLAGFNQVIPFEDQEQLWHYYNNMPVFETGKMQAITSLLPEFAKLLGSHVTPTAAPAEPVVTPEHLPLVDRMLRLIQDNDGEEEISLKSMARELHASPEHMSREFRRIVGVSFRVYLNRARVARARVLMESSPSKCVDVAFESGFNSKAAFNRWFVKLTGKTPREFRPAMKG